MGRESTPRADALAQHLGSAAAAPEPADWRSLYTPEQAEVYAAELEQLEIELDDRWPGWRRKEPFTTVGPELAEWIKVRLKRRDLIVHGHGRWGIHVTYRPAWGHDRWPAANAVPPNGQEWQDPFRPVVSVPLVARQLGVRARDVRGALEHLPEGERAVVPWLRSYLERRVERVDSPDLSPPGAPSPAPPPIPADPPSVVSSPAGDLATTVRFPVPAAPVREGE